MLLEVLLGLILVICFYTDIFQRKIYNWASLGGAAVGIILNIYYFGLSGLAQSLLGWLLGIVIFAIPYALGGMGAGDAKLLGTVGAYMGPVFTFHTFLITGVLGGLYALAVLVYRRKFLTTVKISMVGLGIFILSGFKVNTLPDMDHGQVSDTIPYGALIGAAVLLQLVLGG